MNKYIKEELEKQASAWFMHKAMMVPSASMGALLTINGHFIGVAVMLATFMYHTWKSGAMQAHFDDRLKRIAFTTQLENLYVYSINPDHEQDSATAKFKEVVSYLKEVGNVHEVRVHLLMYRDVKVFTWWWDTAGRLQKKDEFREKGCASESWEEYQSFCHKFEQNDRENRLRDIRKDNAGFDWVNENLFNQNV